MNNTKEISMFMDSIKYCDEKIAEIEQERLVAYKLLTEKIDSYKKSKEIIIEQIRQTIEGKILVN